MKKKKKRTFVIAGKIPAITVPVPRGSAATAAAIAARMIGGADVEFDSSFLFRVFDRTISFQL